MGQAYHLEGDPRRAATFCEDALELCRRIDAQNERGLALLWLGRAKADLDLTAEAEIHWCEALPIFERLGAPEADTVRRLLRPTSKP
jgi:hypothetical protein